MRSYRTLSPLPGRVAAPRGCRSGRAVCFLWHFPWGLTPAGR
ncbi:hypothetical protein RADP37_05076 [Roseomonas mucosa]|uniref:Uncharacterized protein n=1 Tax=Roseomonas mucosa TaxID=207340 RepID=A0A4Y1N1M7_9PROT|nr:hypothetical protein RADP37_05076 [Roseomonas mucosa]QDE01264.1 hypothetical protein ADP8_05076 [Roseomonas mucosa]